MPRRAVQRIVGLVLGVLVIASDAPPSRAEDRVGELTVVVVQSRNEKERVAAVSSLARMEDKAALRPLVTALSDASATVRGIAATGLGRLGHKAALPALRDGAINDPDAGVRKSCADALARVTRANGLPAETLPVAATTAPGTTATAQDPARAKLHVLIRSAADESPSDARTRKLHADVLRQTLADEIAASSLFARDDAEARKRGLETRQLDISIVKLETRTHHGVIEVEAQLRVTISDHRGKMMSFLSGGAAMQVKRKGYNLAYLPQLRRDTVANAVRGISAKLVEHLRRTLTS